MASIESRSDANKALFQQIQMKLLEQESSGNGMSEGAKVVFKEAQDIIDFENKHSQTQ